MHFWLHVSKLKTRIGTPCKGYMDTLNTHNYVSKSMNLLTKYIESLSF